MSGQADQQKAYKRAYYLANRDRLLVQRKKLYRANREEFLKKGTEYYQQHKDQCKERSKRHRENNPELYRQYMREWKKRNPGRNTQLHKVLRAKTRRAAFKAYGGACACCGESRHEFLSIDHIAGGGNKHRKDLGLRAGWPFYRWLRLNNWPKDFQVLCFNCNCARGFFGYCPHEAPLNVPHRESSEELVQTK